MSLLTRLAPRFRVDAVEPPSTEAEIDAIVKWSVRAVPQEYLGLIREASDIEMTSMKDGSYLRIWGARDCIEMSDAYHIQSRLPGSLALGDDGGGRAIILMNGSCGDGVYLVGYGALDVEDAVWVSPSLANMLFGA